MWHARLVKKSRCYAVHFDVTHSLLNSTHSQCVPGQSFLDSCLPASSFVNLNWTTGAHRFDRDSYRET